MSSREALQCRPGQPPGTSFRTACNMNRSLYSLPLTLEDHSVRSVLLVVKIYVFCHWCSCELFQLHSLIVHCNRLRFLSRILSIKNIILVSARLVGSASDESLFKMALYKFAITITLMAFGCRPTFHPISSQFRHCAKLSNYNHATKLTQPVQTDAKTWSHKCLPLLDCIFLRSIC